MTVTRRNGLSVSGCYLVRLIPSRLQCFQPRRQCRKLCLRLLQLRRTL